MKFIILGLCVIGAVMAGYPIFSTSTYPLVICASLNADYSALGTTTFPDALMESNCVAIDVCAEVNNRGESVPKDTWLHRSLDSLVYDGEHDLAATGVYNYFNIEYARIPAGVEVQFCAPAFAHHRTTNEYVCDNMTLTSVSSDCPPISYTGSAFDMTACLSAAQYDAQGEFTAASYGTTQMLRYSFLEDWGCLTDEDVSAGIQLSSVSKPNILIPCQEIPHAIYNVQHGCEFTCEYGYTKGVGVCDPNCVTETEITCAADHRVASECNLMTPSRYLCEQCPVSAGQRTLPWNPATSRKTQCQYEDCPAGTYGVNGGCEDCPINYKSTGGAAECQLCEHGFHQPETGKTSCVACFSETVDTTNVCGDGEMLLRNVSVLDDYYASLNPSQQSTYDLLAFCADSYACVPCKPGYYEDGHTCQSCEIGKYQPNFKMSECFSCSTGQTTTATASDQASDCVCMPGFE